MSKCPKCKKQIDVLEYRGTHSVISRFERNGVYTDEGIEDYSDIFYSCPECFAVLFEDEDGAIKFFKGGK